MDRFMGLPFLFGMTKVLKESVSFSGIVQTLLIATVSSGVSVFAGMYVTQAVFRVEMAGIKEQVARMEKNLEKIDSVVFRPVYEKHGMGK